MVRMTAGTPVPAVAPIAALLLVLNIEAFAQTPLDLLDPTPRSITVRVENSSDLAVVGASFGPPFPATYSASGNTGTLVISAETHEQMRAGFPEPVPSSFTPIVIEFDLTTFSASSLPASGAHASGPISSSFTQGVLDTAAVAGFIGPDVPPLYCTSQAEVDSLCMIVPLLCDQVCTIVPGANYNPLTGQLNMVGSESRSGCDGAMCSGPFSFFASQGDLRITEGFTPMGRPPGLLLVSLVIAAVSLVALRALMSPTIRSRS